MLSGGFSSGCPAQDDTENRAYQPWNLPSRSMSATTSLGMSGGWWRETE